LPPTTVLVTHDHAGGKSVGFTHASVATVVAVVASPCPPSAWIAAGPLSVCVWPAKSLAQPRTMVCPRQLTALILIRCASTLVAWTLQSGNHGRRVRVGAGLPPLTWSRNCSHSRNPVFLMLAGGAAAGGAAAIGMLLPLEPLVFVAALMLLSASRPVSLRQFAVGSGRACLGTPWSVL
jgi:hypothetical protein